MSTQSEFLYQSKAYNQLNGTGLADVAPQVRRRAEKIKEFHLLQLGETLLERMEIEVPRRLNFRQNGASDVPELRAYYRQFGSDPKRVAEAWRKEFPDLFPLGINESYTGSNSGGSGSSGSSVSGGSSGLGIDLPGKTVWWIAGGVGVAAIIMLNR